MKVISAHSGKGELQPLVYPLAQILLGAARLVPTPRYFPLRLRLVRALNRLAQSTGVYIPVAPVLLEMLHWSELKRKPVGGGGTAPDLLLLLRLSKVQLKGAPLQEEVVNQVRGGSWEGRGKGGREGEEEGGRRGEGGDLIEAR